MNRILTSAASALTSVKHDSCAPSRSSFNRATVADTKASSAKSAYAGPRHSASASSSRPCSRYAVNCSASYVALSTFSE